MARIPTEELERLKAEVSVEHWSQPRGWNSKPPARIFWVVARSTKTARHPWS